MVVARVKVESLEDVETHLITEENLNRHLDNDAEEPQDEEQAETDETSVTRLTEDYALQQALNVLKGLQILTAEAE